MRGYCPSGWPGGVRRLGGTHGQGGGAGGAVAVLGGQLATMNKWPEILSGAAYQGFSDVVALIPELTSLLAAATDASVMG